jgi:hypothetical protein
MACERYEDALKQMAAGFASTAAARQLGAPRVESEFESHLAGCARCREELEALRNALALVDAELDPLAALEPSPDLAARIRRSAAEDAAEPARRPAWLWPALAAAAGLLVAFAILMRRPPAELPVAAVANRLPQAAATALPPVPSRDPSSKGGSPALGPAVVATSRSEAADRVRTGEPRGHLASPEPEVLVPPGQVEALQRFARLVNSERVASPSLAAVEQGSPEIVPPPPIEVRSVEIKPLEIVPSDAAEDSGT